MTQIGEERTAVLAVLIDYLTVSLEDVLANGMPWKLPAVWRCTRKLVKATKELHRIGILYLCWKGIGCIRVSFEVVTPLPLGEQSIVMSVCLSVCLFVYPRAYLWNTRPIFAKFLCMLPIALARSSGGVAIRYVLPVYGWHHTRFRDLACAVCVVLGTPVHCVKTAEPIEVRLGDRQNPSNHVLDCIQIPHGKGYYCRGVRCIENVKSMDTCWVLVLLLRCFFSAGGIILSRSDDIESVQLTDFTNAITVSQLEDDAEIAELLRDSLSPETIPPEVRALFSFSHHHHHFICIKIKTCRIQRLPFKQH